MDLFDVLRSCLRRWYVTSPLLLISTWVGYHVYSSAPQVYYSSAVVGVSLPSSTVPYVEPGTPVAQNGLLQAGGGATLLTTLANLSLRDANVVAQVVASGGQPDYTTKQFPGAPNMPPLPLILIEATQPDPTAALKTVEAVAAQTGPVIHALQQHAGVPESEMAAAFTATPATAPVAGTPSRTRATVGLLIAGYGLSLLLTVVLDVILGRRKSRSGTESSHRDRPTRPSDGDAEEGLAAAHRRTP